MNFSQFYSNMYDKIHASKVYSEEVIQISNFIIGNFPSARTLKILDFGCGTGVHLANLADESFEVMGYDPNKFMLDLGKMKYPELNFTDDYGSIPNGMDFVYSIFDVASYQVTVEELELFFRQIAGTLRIGGVILIDGWHLHGVKLDPPESRQRSFEIDGIRICRRVEPISGDDFRTTSLHISLINEDNGEVLMREIHTMRAFTSEEISTVAKKVGFNDIHFRDGKDWGKELDNSSWRFMMFAEYLGY